MEKNRKEFSSKRHDNITKMLVKSAKRSQGIVRSTEKQMTEASSPAVRMQRALEKIKADRERRERLAAPYVNSVFGKKDEKKPEEKK